VVALFYDSGFEDEEPTRRGHFEGLSLSVNIPGLDRELILEVKNIQGMDDNWASKVKSRHGEFGRT
jgi:hypothetical protein